MTRSGRRFGQRIKYEDEMRGAVVAQLTEEMSAGSARIRVDLVGSTVPEHVLENMDFLNYRLAAVRLEPEVTLSDPDITWNRDAADKSVS